MAKLREVPCKYYVCMGTCSKRVSINASIKGVCQTCSKYTPRAKVRLVNKKKQFKSTYLD